MAFGLIPLHGWDVWLHGVTAAFAAYHGYGKQAQSDEIPKAIDQPPEPFFSSLWVNETAMWPMSYSGSDTSFLLNC